MRAQGTIIAVWAVLCVTTLASTLAASGGPLAAWAGIAVLGAAFAKVFLVLHYFMELDRASLAWRAPFIAWTVLVFLVLSGLLLAAA